METERPSETSWLGSVTSADPLFEVWAMDIEPHPAGFNDGETNDLPSSGGGQKESRFGESARPPEYSHGTH
jgi:hypothetical protein